MIYEYDLNEVEFIFVVSVDKTFEFKAIYNSLALGLQQSVNAGSLFNSKVCPVSLSRVYTCGNSDSVAKMLLFSVESVVLWLHLCVC